MLRKLITISLIFSLFCPTIQSRAENRVPLSDAAGKSKIQMAKGTVAPEERLETDKNYVRSDTDLKVRVESKKFQPFAFGRGNDKQYRSEWFEIGVNEVIFYDMNNIKKNGVRELVKKEMARYEHGLNLSKAKVIEARVDVVKETATLYLSTSAGKFETKVKGWFGGGEPFVQNLGNKPFTAELSFERKTADQPIWFYGDSYLGAFNNNRWPYYMRKDGNDNWMMDHLPGGSTKGFVEIFRNDLKCGTPKIVIWTLIGNNRPDKDTIDKTWLKDTEEFLAICKENGIVPILEICPGKRHPLKNEWIRNSGYRYIDLFSVVCNEDCSWKDPAWLSRDKVHPTEAGAKAMWEGIKVQVQDLFK